MKTLHTQQIRSFYKKKSTNSSQKYKNNIKWINTRWTIELVDIDMELSMVFDFVAKNSSYSPSIPYQMNPERTWTQPNLSYENDSWCLRQENLKLHCVANGLWYLLSFRFRPIGFPWHIPIFLCCHDLPQVICVSFFLFHLSYEPVVK